MTREREFFFADVRRAMEKSGQPYCIARGSFYNATFELFDSFADACARYAVLSNEAKQNREFSSHREDDDGLGFFTIDEAPITCLSVPVLKRELPKPEKRKSFTPKQRAELLLKQDGRCAGCEVKLGGGSPYHIDHIVPLDALGSNDAENLQCLCAPCHLGKTAVDISRSAKGRRIRGETGNGRKAEIPQPRISTLSKKHPNYRKPEFGKRGFAAR